MICKDVSIRNDYVSIREPIKDIKPLFDCARQKFVIVIQKAEKTPSCISHSGIAGNRNVPLGDSDHPQLGSTLQLVQQSGIESIAVHDNNYV